MRTQMVEYVHKLQDEICSAISQIDNNLYAKMNGKEKKVRRQKQGLRKWGSF